MVAPFSLLVSLIVALGSCSIAFSQPLYLPPLSGNYGVGTVSQVLSDSSRLEILSETPDDLRKVILQLWYPAQEATSDSAVPYLSGDLSFRLASLHLKGLEIEGKINRAQQAHGRPKAPVAAHPTPFPVLVFSPGFGVPATYYRHFIEDIVSHGYVVAAINHPYFSGISVFPDDRAVQTLAMTLSSDGDFVPAAEQPEGIALPDGFGFTNITDILVQDVKFVVDSLKNLAPSHPLYGRLELSKFGIYGQSLGGILAMHTAREMPQCKAAFNIDGWSDELENQITPAAFPLFILVSAENAPNPDAMPPKHIYTAPNRYLAVLEGSSHVGFIDLPYLSDQPTSPARNLGTINPNALRQTTNAILLAFFDHYLKEDLKGGPLAISDRYKRAEEAIIIAGAAPDTSVVEGLYLAPATIQRIRLPKAPRKDIALKPLQTPQRHPEPHPAEAPKEPAILQSFLLDTPKHLSGHIRDDHTGIGLPAATVQVIDSFKGFTGTIANEDGGYALALRALPARLKISCIGYRSTEYLVSDTSASLLNITLQPTPIPMEAVQVRSDNPANAIMRKVLAHKPKWRSMQSYSAEAYERQHLQKDTTIVAIREYVVEIYWDKEAGQQRANNPHRADIRGVRGTTDNAQVLKGLDPLIFMDFYHDYVFLQGSKLLLPTHPQALDHYTFSLLSQRYLDDKTVYDLAFKPKRRINSGFVGTLSVLDQDYALLEIELQPSPSATASFHLASILDIHWTFRQKFRPFAESVWLPVDMEFEVSADFLGLNSDLKTYRGTMQLTDFQIDAPSPESISTKYNQEPIGPLAATTDSVFAPYPKAKILSQKEVQAYKTLGADAPTTITPRAQKPADTAPLPWLLPEFWFNRVDAFHLGLNAKRPLNQKIDLHFKGAYKTGPKRWAYGAGLRSTWGPDNSGTIQLAYQSDSRPRYESPYYPLPYNSAAALFGVSDYYDYYQSKGTDLKIGYRLNRAKLAMQVAFHDQTHSSLKKSTNFDLLGRSKPLRANPAIQEGRLRSVGWRLTYGEERLEFGRGPQRRLQIGLEHSADKLLASDFDFTCYYLTADWRFPTLFRHKDKPNSLDLRLVAATSTGTLPLQRFTTLDTGLWGYAPFGTFRALGGRPYEGEKHLGLFWQHNFRTAPFEMLGLWGLARRQMSLALYGGFGRTWISSKRLASLAHSPRYTAAFHHEIGLSWSYINLFRLDLTRRLDQRQWKLGVSISPILNQD